MVGLPSGTVWRGCPSDDGKVTPCPSLSSLLGLQDQKLLLKGDPPSSPLPVALELDSRHPSHKGTTGVATDAKAQIPHHNSSLRPKHAGRGELSSL